MKPHDTVCAQYRDWLAASAAGALPAAQQHEIEEHVAQCEHCTMELAQWQRIGALARGHAMPGPIPPFADAWEQLQLQLGTPRQDQTVRQARTSPLRKGQLADIEPEIELPYRQHPLQAVPILARPHQRLKGQLSALGAVAAVLLITVLAVSLFARGPILHVGSPPTSTVLVPTPTVSLPTPIPVSTPTVSVFSAPGPNDDAQAVGPDGSLAYIVGNNGSANHPELVYVSPAGKVKTFNVPTVAGAANGARITIDGKGDIVGSTSAYISATKSVNITWLLDPRSGAVKDLSGGWCPAQGCTLGPDGFFWTYSFTGNLGDPTGHFLGVISRIDPDTNQTVSQTPVPAWIRSHVTMNAQGTTLLFFGVGSGGLTWFSVLYASHIWLASFNVNSGVLHTIELPRSFATVPEGPLAGMEITASMEEEPVVAPDGSLWDVVQSTPCSGCAYEQSTIYRYTADGHLTSFPNPLGDGHVPGGQPVYFPFPMPGPLLGYYVSDQYSNLCTFVLTGVASNGTGGVWTYHCLSPQGAVLIFGQVAAESIDGVGTWQVAYTNYHSIWVSGSGVALVEFPLSVRTPAGDVP